MGSFTGTLQAAHHDDGRDFGRNIDPGLFRAHQRSQFLVDNFDDMLSRGQALQHLGTDGLFGNAGDKIFCHLIVDVRLQQSEANFPHGLFHISLGQLSF